MTRGVWAEVWLGERVGAAVIFPFSEDALETVEAGQFVQFHPGSVRGAEPQPELSDSKGHPASLRPLYHDLPEWGSQLGQERILHTLSFFLTVSMY